MRRRLANSVLAALMAAGGSLTATLPASAEPVPTCGGWYDYAAQWTATSSTYHHPGNGCIVGGSDTYYGWVGINGQIQAPSHFPNLCCNQDTTNHSLGWLEMAFTNPPGWIQVGWIAGCLVSVCSGTSTLSLYDESVDEGTTPYTTVAYSDGQLSFGAADIVNVEYYPDYYPNINCWIISDNYNNNIRWLCSGGKTWNWHSGAAAFASETCVCDMVTGAEVEMPLTVYGYSNPNTNNALRIKGAAGYVPWTSSLSSYTTSWYDERNCPNSSYCPSPSPPYYLSGLYAYYEIEAYGYTS